MSSYRPRPDPKHGFTLIELLMVITIMMLMMGLLMPVLALAQRLANRSGTLATMHKLDSAIRQFRADTGCFPYQQTYADPALGQAIDNRLYAQLGKDLQVSDVANLHADTATAAAQYAYACSADAQGNPVEPPGLGGGQAFCAADVVPAILTDGINNHAWIWDPGVNHWWPSPMTPSQKMGTAAMLNRMGAERGRRAVLSGNVSVGGVTILPCVAPDGTPYAPGRDNSHVPLVATPASAANPGWASDYLSGSLEPRCIRGSAVLDSWGSPLIYVCQVVEGCQSTRAIIYGSAVVWADARQYGLIQQGRRSLVPVDAATGAVLAAAPPALPDPAQPWHSDRRVYAAPGYENGFELWSAGPDGRFDWVRDSGCNRDNVSLADYDRGLP